MKIHSSITREDWNKETTFHSGTPTIINAHPRQLGSMHAKLKSNVKRQPQEQNEIGSEKELVTPFLHLYPRRSPSRSIDLRALSWDCGRCADMICLKSENKKVNFDVLWVLVGCVGICVCALRDEFRQSEGIEAIRMNSIRSRFDLKVEEVIEVESVEQSIWFWCLLIQTSPCRSRHLWQV